jgi:ferredoxin-NADP reductase/Na+-translocating ferredoxin:NAD+ oxidoreductase RnfD subunit
MKRLADYIDAWLNRVTMYRLVVYVLSTLTIIGLGAALLGHLSTCPTEMVVSLFLLIGSAFITDSAMAKLFHVPTNSQSWLITALILFLIVHPATTILSGFALVLAGAISSASKFLITIKHKHFLNPAALAAAFLSLTGLQATTWWIGSALFWPFTLIFGLIVVRKMRRIPLVTSFITVAILVQAMSLVAAHQPFMTNFTAAVLSSPLLFLATIMLTEPATMPPRQNTQIIFGALVGVLYVTAWQIGPLIVYPEVALLIGNIFAYIVSPKVRVGLKLQEIQRVSSSVYNYVFAPSRNFAFMPGQFMEWTLPGVAYDSRGNRRSFTLASSPTEKTVQLGVKYYEPASTYKAALASLVPGDMVYASQLAGDFTLSSNQKQKLAFIAGGIGITPFRSMVKYLLDKNIPCDIILLYSVSDAAEIAYRDVFQAASKIGVKMIPILTKPPAQPTNLVQAKLSSSLIARLIPDYTERMFYISGPNLMVDRAKSYLEELDVAHGKIKTDHFSGY